MKKPLKCYKEDTLRGTRYTTNSFFIINLSSLSIFFYNEYSLKLTYSIEIVLFSFQFFFIICGNDLHNLMLSKNITVRTIR